MVESYERTFGVTPEGFSSPLENNNHPELDPSEELGTGEITLFQSHIGCLQWCVTLGRLDIATAVMTMPRYQDSPRKGQLKRTKLMIGYLRKLKSGSIRIQTGIPDYSWEVIRTRLDELRVWLCIGESSQGHPCSTWQDRYDHDVC
jgi:hypothetical protein